MRPFLIEFLNKSIEPSLLLSLSTTLSPETKSGCMETR